MLVSTSATSVRVPIRVLDTSLVAVTGLAYNTAGLVISYRKPSDSNWVTITKVAGGANWVSGGFREYSGGVYELSLPNLAISSGECTVIRLEYTGIPTLYDMVEARLPPSSKVVVVDYEVPVVSEALSFTITQRDDYKNTSEVGAIGPIRVETTLDLTTATSITFGATMLIGTERYDLENHFEGTVVATPVSGMPDHYDLLINITSEELVIEAGDYAWDIEANYTETAIINTRTFLSGFCTVKQSMGVF